VAPQGVRTPLRTVPIRTVPVGSALVSSVLAGALIILSCLLLVGGGQAWADPTPSVAQIEQQLTDLWRRVEPQVEKYNLVHEQYLKNKAKQAQLQKQIEPLENAVLLGQLRAGYIAAEVYKGGNANELNAILVAGDPQSLVDQLTMIDALAREQQRQLQSVADLKARYDQQKAPIDALVATLAQQDAQLAAQKKAIDAQMSQLQALRIKAYGSSNTLGLYRPWPCPATFDTSAGYKAAAFACSQTGPGHPYSWGAAGPKYYDCSGLTMVAWARVGIYLPHNANMQYHSMVHVSRANLRIGDLVFYNSLSHVAIYVGGGHVVQAPAPGDVVRMSGISDPGYIYGYGRPNG
jgi:peptidoglycan DL-endopeptidase CwlO